MTAGLPPGPTKSPLLQAFEWVRRPLSYLEECHSRFGDVFTLRFAGAPPFVMVSDPEIVREVFTGDPELLRSGEANDLLQAGLGKRSLLLLDGQAHLSERRLMLPPFHGDRMRRYRRTMTEVAETKVATWPADRPFPIAPAMRDIALEVIMRAVFGVDEPQRLRRLEHALRRWLDTTTSPFRILLLLLIKPDGLTVRTWQRYAPTMKRVDGLLLDEIRRRRTDAHAADRDDIMSLLLQARDEQGRGMDDSHLRDELLTLLVAGHETTATALAWALERLARDPDSFERLVAESHDGGDEYAEAVVKETLRVRTILPFVVRQLSAPASFGGFDLPAGVRITPCIHLVHRRADLYPDPEQFRPERFLERGAGTYTWFPFGGGTRRCLGGAFAMFEMKSVLQAIARAGVLRPGRQQSEGPRRRGFVLVPAQGGLIRWQPHSP